jgi:hypothetical protein
MESEFASMLRVARNNLEPLADRLLRRVHESTPPVGGGLSASERFAKHLDWTMACSVAFRMREAVNALRHAEDTVLNADGLV